MRYLIGHQADNLMQENSQMKVSCEQTNFDASIFVLSFKIILFFLMSIDLDGRWSMQWGDSPEPHHLPQQQQQQRQPGKSYSSSTTVIIKQRPDGVSLLLVLDPISGSYDACQY